MFLPEQYLKNKIGEMKEIVGMQVKDRKVSNEKERELLAETGRGKGESSRTGEERRVSLITLCDTLNYRGASQCNIHFY